MHRKLPYKRAQRVADLMRQVVSEILMRRLEHHGFEAVTVTDVDLSDDLQHAKIFYRVLDPKKRIALAKELSSTLPQIRKEVGKGMELRYTPQIRFEYDESFEQGDRIEALLRSIKREGTEPAEEE